MKFILLLLLTLGTTTLADSVSLGRGNALFLNGVPVSTTAPTSAQVLTYNSTTLKWEAAAASAGGAVNLAGGSGSVTGVLPALNGGSSEPYQITNCSVGVTVAASAVTFTLLDGAGAALSATSPCIISFRNATAATGTYTQVTTTAAVTLVGSNGAQLGCPTAAAQCVIDVYAVNNAGTVVLGVKAASNLDEGSVQTSVALVGDNTDDAANFWTVATQTSKAIRHLSRVTITPAASFAWTNAVTEISPRPAAPRPWYVNANITSANITISNTSQASMAELTNSALTMVPISGSAPVGTVCSTTNAATAPSTGTTTCAAGNEGLGGSFTLPTPGIYEVCSSFSLEIANPAAAATNVYFVSELIETPTGAQTITLEGGERMEAAFSTPNIAGNAPVANYAIRTCSIFNWMHKPAGTIVAVRVMYESSVTGTPASFKILCDETNGRSCLFSAKRL